MPSPTRGDKRNADTLAESNLIDFEHVAAGHEGVRCTTEGDVVIKPCTQEEIAFYESATAHTAFQEFMPKFYGTLSLNPDQTTLPLSPDQDVNALSTCNSNGNGNTLLSPASAATSPSIAPTETVSPMSPDMSSHILSPVQPSMNTTWTPSGGRKIDTGLSIVLENITDGFQRPNILDVKLGSRLWADDAPPAKRVKLDAVSGETTSCSLGFRIAGMKVWKGDHAEAGKKSTIPLTIDSSITKSDFQDRDGYRCYDKWYGRRFTPENVKQGFEEFLAGAKTGSRDRPRLLAQRMARDVRRIQSVLEQEESRMYSASILVVYEGDPEALEIALEDEQRREVDLQPQQDDALNEICNGNNDFRSNEYHDQVNGFNAEDIHEALDFEGEEDLDAEDSEEELFSKVTDVRLIDFAHAGWTPGQGPDENALKGVRSIGEILDSLAGS